MERIKAKENVNLELKILILWRSIIQIKIEDIRLYFRKQKKKKKRLNAAQRRFA